MGPPTNLHNWEGGRALDYGLEANSGLRRSSFPQKKLSSPYTFRRHWLWASSRRQKLSRLCPGPKNNLNESCRSLRHVTKIAADVDKRLRETRRLSDCSRRKTHSSCDVYRTATSVRNRDDSRNRTMLHKVADCIRPTHQTTRV